MVTGTSETKALSLPIAALERQLGDALPDTQRAALSAELAWELRRLDPKRSLELAQEAYDLAEKNSTTLAMSLLVRGHAYARLADYERSRQDAECGLRLFKDNEDWQGVQRTLNLLGIVYGQLGDLGKALETFLQAHTLCHGLHDLQGAAIALNNAALCHTHLGDYASALELYLDALRLYEQTQDQEGTARTLTNIGSAYHELGRFEDALRSCQKALDLYDVQRDPQGHANILLGAGRSLLELGTLTEARAYTKASLELFEACEDALGVGHALATLGQIDCSQGNLPEAQRYFYDALRTARDVGDRLGEVKVALALAKLIRGRDHGSGLELLLETLPTAEGTGSKTELYRVHGLIAELYEQAGEYASALKHHKRYAAIKDEVFNETSDRKLQSLRVGFQVEQTEREREIFRLKNVELAEANHKLQALNNDLLTLNGQKTQLVSELERLAREDSLTGLYNRRHFDSCMRSWFQGQSRPVSIMICDIDNFKRINDSFSHQKGDEVLTEIAKLFRASIREQDVLARYGGEEFILAMRNLSPGEAERICERLRRRVETHPWHEVHPDLKVTLSLGLASGSTDERFERLSSIADSKLYEAKGQGKNRLCS